MCLQLLRGKHYHSAPFLQGQEESVRHRLLGSNCNSSEVSLCFFKYTYQSGKSRSTNCFTESSEIPFRVQPLKKKDLHEGVIPWDTQHLHCREETGSQHQLPSQSVNSGFKLRTFFQAECCSPEADSWICQQCHITTLCYTALFYNWETWNHFRICGVYSMQHHRTLLYIYTEKLLLYFIQSCALLKQ